ncbi:MAG: hypothetical protein NDJ89_16200 [Oligoflexia bacterium]|nr:hypothetical protein [Oligoflexia bacterium]
MRKIPPTAPFGAFFLLLSFAHLAGCASVPHFAPSRSLETVPSLQEGLMLCNEYRLPRPSERPVELKPYVECLDTLARRFPDAGPEAVAAFREELTLQYRLLREAHWSPGLALELESAIHAVLRALWRVPPAEPAQLPGKAPLGYTPSERELALKHFPRTAQQLGARDWPVSSSSVVDPRLEAAQAGLAGLLEERREVETQSVTPAELERRARLCERVRDLRSELAYLEMLWRDQRDIAELGPQPGLRAIRERYSRRLEGAERQLSELRARIAEARARQGFNAQDCMKGES